MAHYSTDLDGYVQQSLRHSQTMADAIADALRRAILAGALPAGEVLRQAPLAAKFGVSRVPIREALLKLETDGLVESQPRRGTVVTSLGVDAFQEILEMRMSLEVLALRLSVPRMQEDDLAEASQILNEAQAAVDRASSGPRDATQEFETRWGDLNWHFHRALYLPASRPRLLDTIENLHLLFARHLRVRLDLVAPALLPSAASEGPVDTNEWRGVLQEHRDILDACREGDCKRAGEILEQHISRHGEELVRRLRVD